MGANNTTQGDAKMTAAEKLAGHDPNRKGRYLDAGFAYVAAQDALAAGTLRQFRVKYPAICASCGKQIQKGFHAASPERGFLIGRCCWWPEMAVDHHLQGV